jgi:hypothetical protein
MQSEYRVYIGYLPKELIPQRLLKAKTNYWNSRHVKIPKLFNLRFPIAPESIEMKSTDQRRPGKYFEITGAYGMDHGHASPGPPWGPGRGLFL